MDFDIDSFSLLLEKVKTQLLSLVPTLKTGHLYIFKSVQIPTPSEVFRWSVKYILSFLQRWLSTIGKILSSGTRSAKHSLTTHMAPYAVKYIQAQNVSKTWYHAVLAALQWLARAPHRLWSAVSTFFKHMGHGIVAAAASVLRTVKVFLWSTLLVVIIMIALGILISLAPLFFRFCKRVQASIREEREQAERQRLLEDYERQAAERARMRDEARRKWAEEEEEARRKRAREEEEVKKKWAEEEEAARKKRADEEEEARRKKVHEEAQKQVQERLRKWREQQEFQLCFDTWQVDAEAFFRNMETAQHFPEPRLDKCDACRAQELSYQVVFEVRICQHNLEKLLRAAGNYEDVLRRQRRMWHPDKLSRVGVSVREGMIRKATAMSQMIGALWEKERPA